MLLRVRLEGVCMPCACCVHAKVQSRRGAATQRQVHMALGWWAHQSHQNHRSRTQAMITRDWETGEGEMLLEFPEVWVTTRWVSPTIANHTLKMGKPENSTVCAFLKKKRNKRGFKAIWSCIAVSLGKTFLNVFGIIGLCKCSGNGCLFVLKLVIITFRERHKYIQPSWRRCSTVFLLQEGIAERHGHFICLKLQNIIKLLVSLSFPHFLQ